MFNRMVCSHKNSGIILIGLLFALCRSAYGAECRIETVLDTKWRVQPAQSVNTPPNEKDWADVSSGDFKRLGAGKGTSWEKSDRNQIHSVWLEKELPISPQWNGKSVVLDFRRIEGDVIVFLNGQRIAELLRPGGEVEVTKAANWSSKNVLRIFATRDYTDISRDFERDILRYTKRKNIPKEKWNLGITG